MCFGVRLYDVFIGWYRSSICSCFGSVTVIVMVYRLFLRSSFWFSTFNPFFTLSRSYDLWTSRFLVFVWGRTCLYSPNFFTVSAVPGRVIYQDVDMRKSSFFQKHFRGGRERFGLTGSSSSPSDDGPTILLLIVLLLSYPGSTLSQPLRMSPARTLEGDTYEVSEIRTHDTFVQRGVVLTRLDSPAG